jgi:hypothetical protein
MALSFYVYKKCLIEYIIRCSYLDIDVCRRVVRYYNLIWNTCAYMNGWLPSEHDIIAYPWTLQMACVNASGDKDCFAVCPEGKLPQICVMGVALFSLYLLLIHLNRKFLCYRWLHYVSLHSPDSSILLLIGNQWIN